MMASMFCLFVIEMYLNSKMGGHSHGGPMGFEAGPLAPANRGPPPSRPPRHKRFSDFEVDDVEYEKKMAQKGFAEKMRDDHWRKESQDAESDESRIHGLPPWFAAFYDQYLRQRREMINAIEGIREQQYETDPRSARRQTALVSQAPATDSPYIDEETGQAVDPAVYRKMSLGITLLEGGILFHSVFVGMTISITVDGYIILLVAILFHQMFEGLGLGSRIAAVPYPRGSIRPWLLVVAFGTTAPIGQAIGLAVHNSYDPNSAFALILVGVFNAM